MQHVSLPQDQSILGGGSRGGARDSPPGVQILSIPCTFGEIWQNRTLAPPGELSPPPRGNPGSATDSIKILDAKIFAW